MNVGWLNGWFWMVGPLIRSLSGQVWPAPGDCLTDRRTGDRHLRNLLLLGGVAVFQLPLVRLGPDAPVPVMHCQFAGLFRADSFWLLPALLTTRAPVHCEFRGGSHRPRAGAQTPCVYR